ncbi:MAG: hypothetical protein JWN04_633 [Myxococcaceae bacterium]|nr:hypothetical protein [Myxococcaceae bacterium]
MQEKFGRICAEHYRDEVQAALATMRGGQFYAAHEQLETLFRRASGDQRTLFQALAQLAASHHQLTLGRARAAVRTWHKARAKLDRLGLLSPSLQAAMAAFHAELGIDAEEPRFIDPARLGEPESFPGFDMDTL